MSKKKLAWQSHIFKKCGVDSGMLVITDASKIKRKTKGPRHYATMPIPNGEYNVKWRIEKSWNGNVCGDGVVKIESKKVVVADPSYILGHKKYDELAEKAWIVTDGISELNPNWFDSNNLVLLNKMGGDGVYDVFVEFTPMKEKRYEFCIGITGLGKDANEAWSDAVNSFMLDPGGVPDDCKVIDDEVE